MMALISQDLINLAEATDIVSFCEEHGYPLEKKGRKFWFGVEHDSLVIDRERNYFSWNSRGISGNSILFVQTFFKMNFREAVAALTEKDYEKMDQVKKEKTAEEHKDFVYDIVHDSTTEQVEEYLINERGIDEDIVNALITKGLLKQDTKKNCVFVWGETGKRVGADLQGTKIISGYGKRNSFKQIKSNSKLNYGFNISLGVPKSLYFFEAPIDLLSYWSLNKNLMNCRLISMNGLKEKTILNMIKHTFVTRGAVPTSGVFLGLDNDKAGHQFMDKMKDLVLATNTGQEISFHNLIAGDNRIPREFISLYQAAGEKYSVDWKYVAAMHKVETNFSSTNDISNNFKYGKFFGEELHRGEKPLEINLVEAIHNCAAVLADNMNGGYLNLNEMINNKEDFSLSAVQSISQKIEYYYDMYSDLGYLPSDEPLKDWNDELKHAKGLSNKSKLNSKSFSKMETAHALTR